jgi:1-acyl-sn-glycerol-3-phosphate acyltransferase
MRLLISAGQALFSISVWIAAFTWMLVGVLGTLSWLVLGVPYPVVHRWITAPVFSKVPLLATIRVRVHYHPRFDRDVRCVFMQNHVNLLDGHVAANVIPHAFCGIMNAWQFKIPIYGWLMALSKGIGVHGSRREGIVRELSDAALERKALGMSILAFPEAHRTLDGKVKPFRRGVFLMARNADMPVVPVAVRGLYEANNKHQGWRFRPFRRVDVFVGPQLPTTGLSDAEVAELANDVHAYVVYCMDHGRFPGATAAATSAAPTPPT